MKAQFGMGIYTISDAAEILKVDKSKIRYWFTRYVSGDFRKKSGDGYFYETGDVIAVNFFTLIETYVFYNLKERGVPTKNIIIAHEELSSIHNTPYPFALKGFLQSGKELIHKIGDDIISLNEEHQYGFIDIIMHYADNINFGSKFASKYYPLGRKSCVVVNPQNQFGSPIIDGTNIKVSTLISLHEGGEDTNFIAELYDIDEVKVRDAIKFAA